MSGKVTWVLMLLAVAATMGATGCAHSDHVSGAAKSAVVEPAKSAADMAFDAEVARLVAKYGDRLVHSRYMEGKCEETTYPGWEGFPLKQCTYTVHDKATGADKQATVIMLNAPPDKMARWIVQTCVEVKGTIDPAGADKLFERILGQSGGQFPVAGVVYEDIIPADGLNEIYCFRDGVTVVVEGVPHRGTDPMTPEQVQASLTGKVTKVYTYGRVQSTTPGQYTRNGGKLDVGTDQERKPAWMDAIRESYQAAWNSDYNSLMIAWARENL